MDETRKCPLSDREMELLNLVVTGATNQKIAKDLFISVNTVKVHLRKIFEKLGVESRTEATLVAIREGWVTVEGATLAESVPLPAEPKRISFGQRVALLMAAVLTFMLAFLPPLDGELARGEERNPFSGRPSSESILSPGTDASRWTTLPPMMVPRAWHAAAIDAGRIYAIGGDTDAGVTSSVEVYDPETNRWTSLPDKPTPVSNISAAVAAGRIWVPGGYLAGESFSAAVEAFELATNTWVSGPPLPQPLCAYALVSYDEDLYLFGGANSQGYHDLAYRLDTDRLEWDILVNIPSPRAFAGAAVLNDRIYVVGGEDGQRELASCHVFDPDAQTAGSPPWSDCTPLTIGRSGLGLSTVSSRLYAVGGGWQNSLVYNERFEPETNLWTRFNTPVTGEWRNLALVTDGQRIFALGGWDGSYLDTVRVYQAMVNIFLPITP